MVTGEVLRRSSGKSEALSIWLGRFWSISVGAAHLTCQLCVVDVELDEKQVKSDTNDLV